MVRSFFVWSVIPHFNCVTLGQEPTLPYVQSCYTHPVRCLTIWIQGIIGANPGNPFNISGVAYDATIYSYRIFGCTGSVNDDGE